MQQRVFQSKVKSILTDNQDDREVHRLRSGKLDTKSYKNVSTTGKCFKKSLERKGKKYNISLLVDASGSMLGGWGTRDKSGVVKRVIPPLVETLENVGVKVSISAFNALYWPIKDFDTKLKDFPRLYRNSLDGNYEIKIINGKKVFGPVGTWKDPDEDDDGWGNGESAYGYNFDAWAIHQALLQLKDQEGEKILIVFSDGQPTNQPWYYHNDLKKSIRDYSIPYEIKLARKMGIKVLSLGIEDDSVLEYYPAKNTSVISNVTDMHKELTKLLTRNIKRG